MLTENALNQAQKRASWIERTVIAGAIVLILFIMLYRLDQYPSPWYDEGAFLKVAKNLASNGIYADYSSEGNRYLGPVVSTGPTVLLPIAALFKLVGVTVLGARLPMVVYSLLLLWLVYRLSRRVGTSVGIAALTVILVVVSPGVNFQFYGRVVLGEVAGIVFWIAGLHLWLRTGRLRTLGLVGVGILLGLACITKLQYALFILPAVFASWMIDLIWYRQRDWRYFVIPGAVAGTLAVGWLIFAVFVLGGQESAAANWQAFRGAGSNAFSLDLANMRQTVEFLNGELVFRGLFLSGVVYGLFLAIPRSPEGQRWSMIAWMMVFASAIYMLSIADWTRYAMPALVLAALYLGHLIERMMGTAGELAGAIRQYIRTGTSSSTLLAAVLFVPVLTLLIAGGGIAAISAAFRQGEYQMAYQTADYIRQSIPPDAIIETWDKELSILTDHIFHYPPQIVEIELGTEKWRGGDSIIGTYNFREYVDADYVIVGPFSKFAGVYSPEILEGYNLIETVGYYDIYQRVQTP
ncbi:MAG: glycosyltransferase family 39 protein [Anaerolineae bacterium]|nr:glycosyltransferase family 39 protein [Anaerolineae bacterium]